MSSNTIYKILSSKEHTPHFLKRYMSFIDSCRNQEFCKSQYTEKHHICPKSKDLFPEYKDFKIFSWNRIILTGRQHFIAHWILSKVYKNSFVVQGYVRMMTSTTLRDNSIKFTSRQYAAAIEARNLILSASMKEYYKHNEHPKGMLGKTFKKSAEDVAKTSGKNNGMYGVKRPDLGQIAKMPETRKKFGQAGSNTKMLALCKRWGFDSIDTAKEYFTAKIENLKHLKRKEFITAITLQFIIDYPDSTIQKYGIHHFMKFLRLPNYIHPTRKLYHLSEDS